MKKKIRNLMLMSVLFGVMIFTITGCGGNDNKASEGSVNITLYHGYSTAETDNPGNYLATQFVKYINEAASDKIKIKIVGDGLGGDDLELLDGVMNGTTDMMISYTDDMGMNQPSLLMPSIPFLFNTDEEVYKYLDSDAFQGEVKKYDKTYKTHTLGLAAGGFREMINNKHEIKTVSDLGDLKFRIPQDDLYKSVYEALGANAVPISGDEMFSALQQHTVDGQCMTIDGIVAYGYKDIVKYMSMTNHMYTTYTLVMSADLYNSLTPELQTIIDEASEKAIKDQRQMVINTTEDAIQEIKDSGVKVSTGVDIDSFRNAVEGVWKTYRKKFGTEFWDNSLSFIESNRQ